MGLWGDERGQSVQIGAVLLFGFLVVSMATYQATVVPQQNERVEFRHNQEAQSSLESVRNGLVATANTGESRPVSMPLGTRYPMRTFAVNPPPASGTIRTEGTDDADVNVTVEGVNASDEADGFWNGNRRTYDTGFLVYEPAYTEYENLPTTRYENTVLYNEFANGHRSTLTGQTLVDGRRVHLVVLDGSLRERGVGAYTVDPRPLSVSSNTITVENGSDATIRFPTRLDTEAWTDLVDGEFASVSVETGDPYNTVTVSLTNATYELRLSRVGVGRVADADEPPAYLAVVDPLEHGLTVNRSDTVTLEVRDRYNNPVSGVEVRANNSSTLAVESRLGNRSDADGRVSYTVTPTESGSATLSFAIGNGSGAWENVSYHRRVNEARGGSSGGEDGGTGTGGGAGSGTGGGPGGDSNRSPTVVAYPSVFDDGGPGSTASVPPATAYGDLGDFDGMTADDGSEAKISTEYVDNAVEHTARVGVANRSVPEQAEYELEVRYFFDDRQGAPVDAAVVTADGRTLQTIRLDQQTRSETGGSGEEDSYDLNAEVTEYVRSTGEFYLVFDAPPGGEAGTYFNLYVDYVRLRAPTTTP